MQVLTQTLLEERIGAEELIRLTDDLSSGAVNTDVLERTLNAAEAKILVNVGQRYTLPLTLTNAMDEQAVVGYCLDVAVHDLYLRRDRQASDGLVAAYKAALAWSEKVAAGTLGLLGETAVSSSPASAGKIRVNSSEAVFTREEMQGL